MRSAMGSFRGSRGRNPAGQSSMFPNLLDNQNSAYDVNSIDGRNERSSVRNNHMSKSVAVSPRNGQTLADNVIIKNVTNVVKVDYIEAEYEGKDDQGFAKRAPRGYNGSKARDGHYLLPGEDQDGVGDGDGNTAGYGRLNT